MCRGPAYKYRALAKNENVPQAIRDAALLQIAAQNKTQKTIKSAKSTVAPPSKGNTQFTCTIYSLGNKDYWENDEIDQSKVTNPGELTHIPGVKVKDSSGFEDPSDDLARQKAYEGLEHVYNFYKTVFKRESIDGKGMEIIASIHHSRGIDNALWTGEDLNQMIFGDGGRFDGRGWLAPTQKEIDDDLAEPDVDRRRGFAVLSEWFDNYDIDTIGHELTHGVVQFGARLGFEQEALKQWPQYSEASTLNEHIADCFAIMIKHWVNGHDAVSGNWDFSPNVYTQTAMKASGWTENYCRTFRDTTGDTTVKSNDSSNPKHWKDHHEWDEAGWNDEGYLEVHINGGIASHAFYQAALAFEMGSKTWETVGKIWYDALLDPDFSVPANQTFQFWRDLTVKHAELNFQAKGKDIMVDAWGKVGL